LGANATRATPGGIRLPGAVGVAGNERTPGRPSRRSNGRPSEIRIAGKVLFADRYERRSLLITSNLAFGEWGQVFQGERMTAALLDRLTHRCHIFDMNGESYRFRESTKARKEKDTKKAK
jgi:hypothetical protein